jgi:hypothetical protein
VTQTFCRHNRFIQRCPICRETVPGQRPSHAAKPKRQTSTGGKVGGRGGVTSRAGAGGSGGRTSTRSTKEVRIHREVRSEDDGYRCELVPGIHSSADARRLAREIGFSSGRLLTLTAAPPSLYSEARACEDLEQATWMCFLAAYLSPLQGEQSFVGIRQALLSSWESGSVSDLEDVPLGPRSSHDPARGPETLIAYRRFAEHAGSQQAAFTGEPAWTPQRRFERLFERLALPGFTRAARFDLLVTLGRLGCYQLHADSLHLAGMRGQASNDLSTVAAKRVFAIGDPLLLERRSAALAGAIAVPLETLDLALANWGAAQRATMGFPANTSDPGALERAHEALGL